MALTKVKGSVDNVPNGAVYELGTTASTTSHSGIATGYLVKTDYLTSARVSGSGATARFTGTTTAGNAGNWPYTDGYFYDADGKQFALSGKADIIQFGADPSGVADSSPALQATINSLPTSGGTAYIPDGTYLMNAGSLITSTVFTGGRVGVRLGDGTRVNMGDSATHFLKFLGTDALPLARCWVSGGQVAANEDGCPVGILFQSCAIFKVTDTYFYSFKSGARASLHGGIRVRYGIYGTFLNLGVAQCDVGLDVTGNAALTYRSTTMAVIGGRFQSNHRGAVFTDVFQASIGAAAAFENSDIGVLITASRTSGVNSYGVNIRDAYFERNGVHIQTASYSGSVRTSGVNIEGNLLELVSTTYADGSAFETAGAGDHKLLIGSDFTHIGVNVWSTSSAADEIQLNATTSGTVIEDQAVSNISVNNDSGAYIDRNIATPTNLVDADTTPSLAGNQIFHTANTGATTITNFDDMVYGEEVLLIFRDVNTTIDFLGTNLKGNNNVNYTGAVNEALKIRFDGANKYCTIVT